MRQIALFLCFLLVFPWTLAAQTQIGPINVNGNIGATGSICAPVDGVLNGACYASLSAAISSSDCPAAGCTVDMRSPNANRTLGIVDPGTKIVKVILGPYSNYTSDHAVCRAGLDFGGPAVLGFGSSTVVTSVGVNAQPFVIAPQVSVYSTSCHIHDIQLIGASGNSSQEGIFLDVSTLSGASIQNTTFEHLQILGFNGSEMEFKGRPNDANSANQFIGILDVQLYSGTVPTAPIFKMTGYNGQIDSNRLFVDNQALGNTQDTMYLGPNGNTSSFTPVANQFRNTTLQGESGNVCLHAGGTVAQTFDGGFVEGCGTGISVTVDSSGIGGASNNGLIIKHMYFAGTCCATALMTDTDGFSQPTLADNTIFGTPGAFINGANAANVAYCGNKGPNATMLGCNLVGPFKVGGIAGTLTIGSGTTTTNGTLISTLTSQSQPTITVTGATVTDVAHCSLNAAPVATWQTGIQMLPPVVTANTVTVWLSNPTAGSITPAAAVVRCTVTR